MNIPTHGLTVRARAQYAAQTSSLAIVALSQRARRPHRRKRKPGFKIRSLGNWADPFNWLPLFPFPPTAPTAADDAIINNGGTAQVVTGDDATARSLTLGTLPGGSGTVDVRGTLNVGTSIVLGSSAGSSGGWSSKPAGR